MLLNLVFRNDINEFDLFYRVEKIEQNLIICKQLFSNTAHFLFLRLQTHKTKTQ